MKTSSLHKASLSATNFLHSPQPCKNKALAEENANLRAKVAQLVDEKEKWHIKYCDISLKVSAYADFNKNAKHLLQRMWFHLQNFLVVRDMLDHMLQQEADYEKMDHHNIEAKEKAEPEQVSKGQNIQSMKEEEQQQQNQKEEVQEQQQQQDLSQKQLTNTIVNPVLHLSWTHNQTRMCMPENDMDHQLHHQKDKTRFQFRGMLHHQLTDIDPQQNHTRSMLKGKQEREDMPVSHAIHKARLSNNLEEHQGISLNFSSENDSLKHCNSSPNKCHTKERHEQLLEHNLQPEQQVHGHLTQIQNAPCDKNLRLNLLQCQHLQPTASQNCKLSKCDFLVKPSQLCKVNEPEQPLIRDQHTLYPEKDCKLDEQRTSHTKGMDQRVLKQKETENVRHKSSESDSGSKYDEGVQQQHADLQGQLQTEHDPINTVVQRQTSKFSVAQRQTSSDMQGQIATDETSQLAVDKNLQVALNQGMKLTIGQGELPRNKQDKQFVTEHTKETESLTHLEQKEPFTIKNGKYLSTLSNPNSVDINELQLIHDQDHPFTSDREHLIPVERRQQTNIHKKLQSVEEEEENMRKSTISKENLPSISNKLHSVERGQELNTGNRERPFMPRGPPPVKLRDLLSSLSFAKHLKLNLNKGRQQSSESDQQLASEVVQRPVVQRQTHFECKEQQLINPHSEKQGPTYHVKGQQSIEDQQKTNSSSHIGSTKGLLHPTINQNEQLTTIHSGHLPHYQLNVNAKQRSTVQLQQIVLAKEQSHYTENREQLTIERDEPYIACQKLKLSSGKEQKEQGMTDKQGLVATTDRQYQFGNGHEECSVSNKHQQGIENQNHKLADRQINQVSSDKGVKLKTIKTDQFDKNEGPVLNPEETGQFSGECVQEITIKKIPQLISKIGQNLSYQQPIVEQEKQQQAVKQKQKLEGEQGQLAKGEQVQQTVVKEITNLAVSSCWSVSDDCQQQAAEQAQQTLVEPFTKQALGLSAKLSQEDQVHKFQNTKTKDFKWLPAEQYQFLVTEKEWKLRKLPHYEEALQEHSSLILLSELSKTGFESSINSSTYSLLHCAKKIQQTNTGFETSYNSSTQSILRCTKKIQHTGTVNKTALHISYLEDSTIERIPILTEEPIYKPPHQHEQPACLQVSQPMTPDKLYNGNGRPRRKCTIGVNYVISP